MNGGDNMTQGERVKEIRKALGLTLEKFGEPLGVGKTAISNIEKGNRNLTEQMAKSICREYSVDYMWLTTGDGEMFMESDDDFMEKIDRIMAGENDARKNMIKTLLNASDADIEALDNLIDYYIELRRNKEKD
jgi:transcriptional regulator with XRE-family HTH domain